MYPNSATWGLTPTSGPYHVESTSRVSGPHPPKPQAQYARNGYRSDTTPGPTSPPSELRSDLVSHRAPPRARLAAPGTALLADINLRGGGGELVVSDGGGWGGVMYPPRGPRVTVGGGR